MSTMMTLEQLKAENAPEPEATDDLTPEIEEAEEEVAAEEPEVVADKAGEPEPEETEDEPAEAWMQAEGQTSEDQQHKGPSFKGLKQKLKAKIEVKDDEIANLRAEIDALKGGSTQPKGEPPLPARPKREDFNFDDDAYDEAVDTWNDARQDARQNARANKQNQEQAANSQQNAIAMAVDKHYEGAAKLVEEGKVTEDEYRNADQIVRGTIESVMNGQGDFISDFLISRLNGAGEGSEKVWYHLGRNQAALGTLKDKLANDPNGLDAMIYLGELRATLTSPPAKRVSQAPRPGTRVKGDAKSGADGALLKKYQKAGNDVQARIDLKREAKAKGIDTKSW